MRKKFTDLCIKDAFMFPAVVTDPEICRPLLEVILDMKIQKIEVCGEYELAYHSDYKKVRLDVYAADENNTRFNIEMQVQPKDNLPRRMRYYGSQMDMELLEKGEKYQELPDTFVIFICDFQVFDTALYQYTFRNKCDETGEPLQDGTCKIFLSTKGTNPEDISEELLEFLKYVEFPSDKNALGCKSAIVHLVHNKVREIKKSRSEESRYMLLGELIEDEREEAKSEGRKEMLELISALTADGRADDIPLLVEKSFFDEMCERYHIAISDPQ